MIVYGLCGMIKGEMKKIGGGIVYYCKTKRSCRNKEECYRKDNDGDEVKRKLGNRPRSDIANTENRLQTTDPPL